MRFKPHPKNKSILVGKTYKVDNPINSNYNKTKELIDKQLILNKQVFSR